MNFILPDTVPNEQAVIGSILDDGEGYAEATQILTERDFTYQPLATAWRWMGELFANSRPVTMIALTQAYGQSPQWKDVAEAMATANTAAGHIQHAAATLADRASLRRATVAFMRAAERAAASQSFADARPALEKLLMAVFEDTSRRDMVGIREVVKSIQEKAGQPKEEVTVFATPFPTLNRTLRGGFRKKHLAVIGGKSGGGKTTIAENILCHMAANGIRCGVFSLEMDREELTQRALDSYSANVPDFAERCRKVADLPIFISDTPDRTADSIRAAIRLMVLRYRVQVIAVDYLQLIGTPAGDRDNRERQVAKMSRTLKIAAKESNVLILALTQLNEDGEIRESRAVRMDADEVLYIVRAEADYFLWVDKNRHGPSHGDVGDIPDHLSDRGIPLNFNPEAFLFTERSTATPPADENEWTA